MDDPDYEELVDRVRTHSAEAPGSDTERVTIRSLDSADVEGLLELKDAIGDEAQASGQLEFVLSERTAEDVREDDLTDRLGNQVRVEPGMPDDAILLLDPDAVADGELRAPGAVALGTLTREVE